VYVSSKDTSSEAQHHETPAAAGPADSPADVDVIEQAVLRAFDLPVRSLRSRQRGRAEIAFARQVAIYLLHVHIGLTLTDAARLFGRDRTTAAHACRIVEDKRDDRSVDLKVEAIEQSLSRWAVDAAGRPATRRWGNLQ